MREFNFLEFHNNLQKDFIDAKQLIGDIERAEWNEMHSYDDKFYYDDEKEFNKERLVDILEAVGLKIHFAYEYLGLLKMAKS
jgi:hypothetical protein